MVNALNRSLPMAVLFADISGSTALYEDLGNTVAQQVVSDCLSRMTETVQQNGGSVVKTIGDEVLAVFPTADQAACAACALQTCLGADMEVAPRVRVGFHLGPVIQAPQDVFGDAVNVAARVVALAKAGQVLTTQSTVEHFTPVFKSITRFLDQAQVKGKRETIDIYEVIWKGEGLTMMGGGLRHSAPAKTSCLRLRLGNQELELNQSRSAMTVGRDKQNDFIIQNEFTSRVHARIEYRRGKFYLIDQSTNGTFVQTDGETLYVRREELLLRGDGRIGLGVSLDMDSSHVIVYSLS